MPEITLLGWFHTALGIIALASGFYTLARYKEITLGPRVSQVYLVATLVTAATALGIFQHGGFGVAHGLAVMTLIAMGTGVMADVGDILGGFSRYLRAMCYSATLLFHLIPAVTDGLMRLPPDDPILTSIEDPILKMCYLALLVTYIVGVGFQLRWIHQQRAIQASA